MLQFFDTLQDSSGNALVGATVTVQNYPAATPATIYSSNGTINPIANSQVISDVTGQISFYAPDGAYILIYVYKGTTYKTRSPVQIIDPMGFVAATDTGGAANQYVVGGSQYPAQLYVGLKLEFLAAHTNTGASTLNYQALGNQNIVQPGASALAAGMIQANGLTRIEWDGANWQLIGSQSQPFYARTAAEVTAGVVPTSLAFWPRDGVHLKRYGSVGDNVTVDDTPEANALLTGQPNYIPAGTYLFNLQKTPLANQLIYGDGMGKSIVHFKNTLATLNGFAISVNNVKLQDLTIQSDVNGQTSCAGAVLSGNVDNVEFESVEFKGITTKTNNWGVFVSGCTLTNLTMHRCRFDTLDLPVFKANGDASIQGRCIFSHCYATNCTDVFEINSPSGNWTDISIDSCTFDTISQFSVGIAQGQRISVVGCKFSNHSIEAVHIEDGSSDIQVIGCSFVKCNTTVGTVGAVNIISAGVGNRQTTNVTIASCSFDLTQNGAGSPFGITVQAGGGGTSPAQITINGNTFKSKAGAFYPISLSSANDITISDNQFINPNAASQVDAFINAANSIVTGSNNTFTNPKVLVRVDDNSFGMIENSHIDGDLTNFAFISGNTNGSTGVCFKDFTIHRTFTADAVPNWQNIFPAGTLFNGKIGIRFIQNGTNCTWVETLDVLWDGTTLTVSNVKSNQGTGSATPPGAADWRVSGGQLQARSSNGVTANGQVMISYTGPYFP